VSVFVALLIVSPSWLVEPDGAALFLDGDHVARRIADGPEADASPELLPAMAEAYEVGTQGDAFVITGYGRAKHAIVVGYREPSRPRATTRSWPGWRSPPPDRARTGYRGRRSARAASRSRTSVGRIADWLIFDADAV